MDDSNTTVSQLDRHDARIAHLNVAIDLLAREEQRLQLFAQSSRDTYKTQVREDLLVNHARTADYLAKLWRLQAGQ